MNTVTIGGISATLLVGASYAGGAGNHVIGLYAAIVPTGITADVVATFSGAVDRAGCGLWRVTGYTSVTPYATNSGSGGGPTAANVGTGPGMAVFGAAARNNTGISWTGLTASFDLDQESTTISGASDIATAWALSRAVSASLGANGGCIVTAVIQ